MTWRQGSATMTEMPLRAGNRERGPFADSGKKKTFLLRTPGRETDSRVGLCLPDVTDSDCYDQNTHYTSFPIGVRKRSFLVGWQGCVDK